MYYGVTATWGGGARGTECDHLKYAISGEGTRHLFILNGVLSISTTYVKTQHNLSHGKLIVRTPCHAISRIVLFATSVLYPVAAHLASYIMDITRARTYLSYIFVHHGIVLQSNNFTDILQHYTEKYIGIQLGLRSYRQVMCSILCCIARTDFGAPDQDDQDLIAIHSQFGHSSAVAQAHYGIQNTNALAEVSHTAVCHMQRVSSRWHQCLGHSHPHLPINSPSELLEADQTTQIIEGLKGPLSSMVQSHTQRSISEFLNTFIPHLTSVIQGLGPQINTYIQDNSRAPPPPSATPRLPPLIVHPRLQSCLKTLFPGPTDPNFTSSQQAELVQSSFTNEHVLAVLPTGSGKSVAFFGAAILHPHNLFIVVTPFVALTEDLDRRLAATPIRGGQWPSIQDPLSAQIVIVPAHMAGTEQFYNWAEANSNCLKRIFIDKAHHIFYSDSYRPCFRVFHRLTQLQKPITFLTATISPRSIPALCNAMMVDPALLRTIRAPMSRHNIGYSVAKVLPDQLLQKTVELHSQIYLRPEERGIIYTTNIQLTLAIADALNVPYYISCVLPDEQANKEKKSCIFQTWRAGRNEKERWIVATICFAEGVDFASVRHAIIVEPRDMLSFLQESGRLGRDGLPSQVVAVWSRTPPLSTSDMQDHAGVDSMSRFLQTHKCRRLCFRDFDLDVHSCASSHKNVLCDCCSNLSSAS